MPDDLDALLRRLIRGDDAAAEAIRDPADSETDPTLLLAAALVSDRPAELLGRAAEHAVSTRDRQLVAVASAHLSGDDERLDALVRDHLADHPDSVLAAWIAALHGRPA